MAENQKSQILIFASLINMLKAVPKELQATAVERAMIILTNGNNWDMNTLKRWDEPNVVTGKLDLI